MGNITKPNLSGPVFSNVTVPIYLDPVGTTAVANGINLWAILVAWEIYTSGTDLTYVSTNVGPAFTGGTFNIDTSDVPVYILRLDWNGPTVATPSSVLLAEVTFTINPDILNEVPPYEDSAVLITEYGFTGADSLRDGNNNYITLLDDFDFYNESTITGDPHFVSYNNEKFAFHGEPNKFYNIHSDSFLQLNSLFGYWPTSGGENLTQMQEIGIKFGNFRVKIDAMNQEVRMNNILITKADFGDFGSIKTIDYVPENYDHCKSYEGFGTFIKGVLIKVNGYEIFVTFSTDNPVGLVPGHINPPYLNLMMNAPMVSDAHGVLGQTLMYKGEPRVSTGRNGEGIVEGDFRDYEVTSLFDNDFKYNKWYSKSQPKEYNLNFKMIEAA